MQDSLPFSITFEKFSHLEYPKRCCNSRALQHSIPSYSEAAASKRSNKSEISVVFIRYQFSILILLNTFSFWLVLPLILSPMSQSPAGLPEYQSPLLPRKYPRIEGCLGYSRFLQFHSA